MEASVRLAQQHRRRRVAVKVAGAKSYRNPFECSLDRPIRGDHRRAWATNRQCAHRVSEELGVLNG